jgi:hypothetical protein
VTRRRLKEQVVRRANGRGLFEPGDWRAMNRLVEDGLSQLSRVALAYFNAKVSLTVVATTETIDLLALSPRVVLPIEVVVDKATLRDWQGYMGQASGPGASIYVGQWRTAPAGKPQSWVLETETTVRLMPVSDATYTDSFMAGWVYHALTDVQADWDAADTADDSTSLLNVPPSLEQALEDYLVGQYLASEHIVEASAIAQGAALAMDAYRHDQVRRLEGVVVRGTPDRGPARLGHGLGGWRRP